MAKLILTRVTVIKGRVPHEMFTLSKMQEEDPSVLSVELDHTRTVVTTTWDAFEQMKFFVKEGLIPCELDLMQMINNWRRYNQIIKEYADSGDRYYKSKTLYWHWEY